MAASYEGVNQFVHDHRIQHVVGNVLQPIRDANGSCAECAGPPAGVLVADPSDASGACAAVEKRAVEALGTFGKLGVGKPAWGGALTDLRHEFLHRLAFLFLTEPRGYADLNAAFDKPCAAGSGATS